MHAVGARPNFMKAAPLIAEMARHPETSGQFLVHTGQHYDEKMSRTFFDDLQLPRPDVDLGVGSGSHARQTARVMAAFEDVLLQSPPDWLIVYGDVNSTLACALTAAKLGIKVAHVEAGLRSFDRTMPEELNRILTDQLSDMLFTTEVSARRNLLREGVKESKIHFVGNLMIDTLVRLRDRAKACYPRQRAQLALRDGGYVLVTLHRPSNVDSEERLCWVWRELKAISRRFPVVFPVHPRTRKGLEDLGVEPGAGLYLMEPLGYLEFLGLEDHAGLVLTDSGGIQEETTYLGVPCLTLRPNTERPVTIEAGTNRLADAAGPLSEQVFSLMGRPNAAPRVPPAMWDGRAAARIVEVFCSRCLQAAPLAKAANSE